MLLSLQSINLLPTQNLYPLEGFTGSPGYLLFNSNSYHLLLVGIYGFILPPLSLMKVRLKSHCPKILNKILCHFLSEEKISLVRIFPFCPAIIKGSIRINDILTIRTICFLYSGVYPGCFLYGSGCVFW